MHDSKLADEQARLAALHRYDLLDTLPEPAFDRITQLVQRVLNVPISAVSLIDKDRQWFKARQGLHPNQTPRSVSFCAHAIADRTVLRVPDARQDRRFSDNPLVTGPPHIRSYLGAPLPTPDGYNLGALCAIDTVPRDFDSQQEELLKELAAIVVDEFELRMIAQGDHLTGVLTRGGFLSEVAKALLREAAISGRCALLLFDIDYFKSINDTFGHPAGDKVLRAVARTCRAELGDSGLIGRVGGEEFAVLLKSGDAVQTAERLRAAIEALTIEHEPPLKVTASFGVALADPAFASAEAWLARADIGLYAAKRTGRNRCVTADPLR